MYFIINKSKSQCRITLIHKQAQSAKNTLEKASKKQKKRKIKKEKGH